MYYTNILKKYNIYTYIMSASRSYSQNMPNINNLLRSPSSRKSSPNITTNELEKLLRNSGNTPKRMPSPQFSLDLDSFFTPPRSGPKARKIAPSPKKAPSPPKVSSPDRKFSHLHEGTNSGEKDTMGRVIWHGPRGGKFVISTIGKRVPYVNESLKRKVNNHKMEFTGEVDRKGRKIYKGKSGGKFIITNSGRRANPLR
jgi:hypothetical protein